MDKHRMILALSVFAIFTFVLFMGDPSITGFVPTETYSQELDIVAKESQRYILSSETSISSLALSGTVIGNGLVNVYLTDGNHKFLVFTNKRRLGTSMAEITGFAVGNLDIRAGEKLNRIESLPDDYETRTGSFSYECAETCVLDEYLFEDGTMYLDVFVEPGTTLMITEIRYASMTQMP